MNIDTLVKLSQIATPFVLLGLGFFVSISVNKYIQTQKITSDFNTKWSDRFIEKCVDFSDDITSFIAAFGQIDSQHDDMDEAQSRGRELIQNIQRKEWEIQLASAFVGDPDEVLKTISKLFKRVDKVLKERFSDAKSDTERFKELQVQLNKQLVHLQKKALGLK